ncbi:hypothetical protein J4430_00085 [Candidatus Woesearchaeota archaeon]|nr:hypothetical protein [Candidatus Woesearchaeota archaeon]
MKLRVASYSMGFLKIIREDLGERMMKGVINKAARESGVMRAMNIKNVYDLTKGISDEFESMLEEFGTLEFFGSQTIEGRRVDNPKCGCLPPFLKLSEKYGFTENEARQYACRRCLPSYRISALELGLGFKGRLTENGCWMHFLGNRNANK